jgi:hypothetical protein
MVGYTLQLSHRYLYFISTYIFHHNQIEQQKRQEFVKTYARVRLNCTPEEKLELDRSEYGYDFAISTAAALVLISISYSLFKWTLEPILVIPVILLSFILFLGGYFQRKETYGPLIKLLLEKYK